MKKVGSFHYSALVYIFIFVFKTSVINTVLQHLEMKYSKFAKAGVIIILLFSNLSFRTISNEDSFIEVYFTDKLDISNLAPIQSQLSEKNIRLNYDYLKFNSNGKLREIGYHVTYKKASGSYETTDTHTEIGFIIDITPNPKYGILIGTKEDIQKRRLVYERLK